MSNEEKIKEIRDRIKLLLERRNAEIADLMEIYRPTLESLRECLAQERAKRVPKPSALSKYRESESTPPRTCKGCGGELLLATEENVRRVEVDLVNDEALEYEIHWSQLRQMHAEFCCWGCKKQKGWHSRWCYARSVTEEREREREIPEQEKETNTLMN